MSKKRIAMFLDGTWNAVSSNTNVWRLKCLIDPTPKDGIRQITYYDKGVNGFWGGTFGKGLGENILEAYEWLVEQYEPEDEIFIFGFSRGAYTARSLSGLIAKYGVQRAGSPIGTGQIFVRYQQAEDKTLYRMAGDADQIFTLEDRWIVEYCYPASIKMVGVWDTVGSVGVPFFSFEGISRSTFSWMHTGLRIPILNAFHAMAIDEHRKDFSPTLWTVKKSTEAKPRPRENVEQRWFSGAHANVGGGYPNDPLSQRPLIWMLEKARGLGLHFKLEPVDLSNEAAEVIDSYKSFVGGAYKYISSRHTRTLGQDSFFVEGAESTTINETIDGSVFARMRLDDTYRPTALLEWALRRDVDPLVINASVTAGGQVSQIPS